MQVYPTQKDSEKLGYILSKHDIQICHKPHNKLSTCFTQLKSATPTMKQSNIVYSIPCGNCPSTYIGMTSQHLKNRLNGVNKEAAERKVDK